MAMTTIPTTKATTALRLFSRACSQAVHNNRFCDERKTTGVAKRLAPVVGIVVAKNPYLSKDNGLLTTYYSLEIKKDNRERKPPVKEYAREGSLGSHGLVAS